MVLIRDCVEGGVEGGILVFYFKKKKFVLLRMFLFLFDMNDLFVFKCYFFYFVICGGEIVIKRLNMFEILLLLCLFFSMKK